MNFGGNYIGNLSKLPKKNPNSVIILSGVNPVIFEGRAISSIVSKHFKVREFRKRPSI